jgi:nitroimidazol reductase NimA-like FMN-containing flavoprotein (pyridoxamine 5'-phosphate oxidase superfamily)
MFGTLNKMEIDDLLKKQFIGRIGCHTTQEIYVVPISYAYDGEFIYCHTQEGKKIDIMRQNPAVCFEVDALETMATWKSAIVWGTFEELTNGETRARAVRILLGRVYPFISSKKMQLGEHWPFVPDDLDTIKGIVFRIRVTEKTGRFEVNDEPWYYNVKG